MNEEARNIVSLLKDYEHQSGQSVNLQKSGVFFSTNVNQQKKEKLSAILSVHNDIRDIHYLGLPSLVGRSKNVFSALSKRRFGRKFKGGILNPSLGRVRLC